jgi:hypothetical protein
MVTAPAFSSPAGFFPFAQCVCSLLLAIDRLAFSGIVLIEIL